MDIDQTFNQIKSHIKELYLKDGNEWCIGVSFGKDSSMVLTLVWEVLKELPLELRTKKVHVLTSNTGIELPAMNEYLKENIDLVNKQAVCDNLPIKGYLAKPDLNSSYFYQVIGKGNPPVNMSSRFRWCSDRLKIKPIDQVMKRIMKESFLDFNTDHDLYLLLGVRDSESIRRRQSIDKHAISKDSLFAKHSVYKNVMTYHPIKFLHADMLWAYFYDLTHLPWGMSINRLFEFYPDQMMECGIKTEGQGSSCGGGRNGCVFCTVIKRDKMLEDEIAKGHTRLIPVLKYKMMLAEIRNDVRYREPFRRLEIKRVNKALAETDSSNTLFDEVSLEESKRHEYHSFQRAEDLEYVPGSLTFEARYKLLQKLLFVQEETGYELISTDEINAIIACWQEEGYTVDKVEKEDWKYDGSLVFHPDGSINQKETTTESPIFWINREFSDSRNEMIDYINRRKIKTGRSFFFYTSYNDFGEEDQFVYNQAEFLVCDPNIQTYEEAIKHLDEWLYEPPVVEKMDWDAFAQRYYEAAQHFADEGDSERLNKCNKILKLLNYPIVTIGEGQLSLFAS